MSWTGENVSWQWALGVRHDGIEYSLGQEKWAQVWDEWAASHPYVLHEEAVALCYHTLKHFVVTFVEEHPREGLIM